MPTNMPTKIEAEIRGLRELFEEKFDRNEDDHNAILVQTTKTNGSVRKLQQWRSFITGGMAVISMFLIPIIIYLAVQTRQEIEAIENKIAEQLDTIN